MTRWHDKADALSAAWRESYGTDLSRESVALALAPAQLETQCGDAWPGPDGLIGSADDERNWGACTLRSLSDAERNTLDLAGITPTVGAGHAARARAAMVALAAAGFTPPSGEIGTTGMHASGATIHCDSRTVRDKQGRAIVKPYFVWFANFASHKDGAAYYLHLLGPGARKAIELALGPGALARAMYDRRYFYGFKPHGLYTGKDGTEHDGNAENIAAYAALIAKWFPIIRSALVTWGVDARPTLRRGDKGEAVRMLQRALRIVPVDGVFGPRTEAAVKAFQSLEGIVSDGVCGPRTWAALEGRA